MPARYLVNLALTVMLGVLLMVFNQNGIISNYWEGVLILVGINILLATSLNIPVGYLGQLPLGHAGFMAVGGYAASIFLKATPLTKLLRAHDPTAVVWIVAGLLLAAAIAGLVGFLIGIPALRLRGDYLAIITLGFGEIIRIFITNIDDTLGIKLTYGAAGLKRIPKFTGLLLVFVVLAVCLFLIYVLMKSRHGRAILSIRENEIAAESIGINTTFYKTFAFAFSAAIAGVAGALYAGYLGSLYPATFTFMKSIEILVMVVLGGMGSMLGSILSASIYTIAQELLRSFNSYRMVAFATLLILMMLFRPSGLLGDYDFSLSRLVERFMAKRRGELPPSAAMDIAGIVPEAATSSRSHGTVESPRVSTKRDVSSMIAGLRGRDATPDSMKNERALLSDDPGDRQGGEE